jgi:hypothetical protein
MAIQTVPCVVHVNCSHFRFRLMLYLHSQITNEDIKCKLTQILFSLNMAAFCVVVPFSVV